VQVDLAGTQLPSLAPEDMLLTLCAHGASHCWTHLSMICDIAELLRSQKHLDWQQICRRAGSLGSLRMVLLGLSLAHELLGADLPAEITSQAKADRLLEPLVQQVHKGLISATTELGMLKTVLFHLRARERWRDRVRYCFRLAAMPTKEDYDLPLPASLAFLYYLIRPLRLAGKYGFARLQHFMRCQDNHYTKGARCQ
jgi:hypothetical protein